MHLRQLHKQWLPISNQHYILSLVLVLLGLCVCIKSVWLITLQMNCKMSKSINGMTECKEKREEDVKTLNRIILEEYKNTLTNMEDEASFCTCWNWKLGFEFSINQLISERLKMTYFLVLFGEKSTEFYVLIQEANKKLCTFHFILHCVILFFIVSCRLWHERLFLCVRCLNCMKLFNCDCIAFSFSSLNKLCPNSIRISIYISRKSAFNTQ